MRLGGAAHAHTIGPTREVSDPRAYHRTHARSVGPRRIPSDPRARRGTQAARARSQQFRMQFNWVNFQQCPQTLQSQRYGRAERHSVGGIACDIHGKLTGRESCATTHSTASSAAGSTAGSAASDVPAAWHSEDRRRKRPAQAPPRQIKGPRTDSQFNNHLQHQLSRINKPKSHHKTNMICPSS